MISVVGADAQGWRSRLKHVGGMGVQREPILGRASLDVQTRPTPTLPNRSTFLRSNIAVMMKQDGRTRWEGLAGVRWSLFDVDRRVECFRPTPADALFHQAQWLFGASPHCDTTRSCA